MTGTSIDSTDEIRGLHAEAERRLVRGQLGPAQQCCLRILQIDGKHADAHFLLGMIAANLGRFHNALEFIDQAMLLRPDQAEYLAQRARCLAMLKREPEAVACAREALALEPAQALTLDTIGVVFSRAGEHAHAAECYRRATALDTRNAGFHFNLGAALKFLGDFDGADAAYEAAIRCSPRYYKAHSALAQLRRQSPARNHIRRLTELLHNVGDDIDGELHLRHALAKELEDTGDEARAFAHLAAGNARKRASLNYSLDQDRALFTAMISAFAEPPAPAAMSGSSASPATGPVFIIGMPRTGTTLAERILSSHPQVTSAGELQAFGLAVKRAAGTTSGVVLDTETIARARNADAANIGETYLQAARAITDTDGCFTDKLPLNFLYAGFIHLALPEARIICLRRHPLDTVLSNFRQLFSLRFSYYNYAYDLADTAHYYVLFHQLMAHWERVMPGRILQVDYEALVSDQRGQTLRMLEHCGLAWDDACLAFERNTAPVATASAVQVREPMYQRAVARWRRYENELAGARQIIEAAGIAID